MAISDSIQTLSAAFSFGTVLQAAITALLLYLKGHDTKLSQDRRRLVLVVFLLFAALWAQMDFFSLLVPTSKTSGCQITTLISSAFDQIARVAIGAYLLFSIGRGTKSSAEKYVLGSLVSVRVIVGAVFVAFTRPQFAPLCVPQSSMTPIAINVIALDTIIIGILAIRIIQLGLKQNGGSPDRQAQSKALTFVTIGFTIWTATSVPMELGMSSIILLVRTAIPASGLGLLIGMLTIFPGALISQTEDDLTSEAQSPFRPDPPRALGAYNNTSDRSGSPVVTVGYGKNGRLFVTNPSDTPRDSPTRAFQSTRGDDKSKEVKVRITEVRNGAGESSRTGGIGSATAVALGSNGPITAVPAPSAQQKRSLFSRAKDDVRPNIRALGISNPVIDPEAANDPQAPFARMRTIDLDTAAANEKSRRDDAAARTPYTPKFVPLSAEEGLRKSTSTKRKEVPKPKPKQEPMPSISSSADSIISSDISTNGANASSTSASLSPNSDEVRRRSPHYATLEEKQTYKMPPPLQQKLVVGLPAGPRATIMAARQRIVSPKAETVMLLNDIVYDNPAEVNSLIKSAALLGMSPGIPIMKAKDLDRDFRDSETIPQDFLPEYENTLRSIDSATSGSILDRPRPVKRARAKSRGLFPSDITEEVKPLTRRRSRSTGSLMMRKSMLMDNPGSPTSLGALPPLPQPPTAASNLAKLLPKSTSNMTNDEKISMLFPAPPGVLLKRRSSVPSIPSMILDDIKPMSQVSESASNTFAMMDEPESPILRRETYRFSANTYQTIARTGERDSEPTLLSTQISTVSSVRNSVVNYPAPAVQSKPVTILRKPLDSEYEDEVPFSPEDDEVSPMLDSRDAGSDDGNYFLSDDDGSEDEQHEIETPIEENETPVGFKQFPWHRRIGDELPTFSDRRDQSRPRTMPPPPPLLLNPIGKNAAVVVRDAEPDLADSPSRAIAEIQAQLKRFEERDRASVTSLLNKFPSDGSISQTVPDDGREKLLENLEKEMGMQENAWMKLHRNVDRESTGSILTPPALPLEQVRPIRPTVSRESSNESSTSLRSLSTTPGSKQESVPAQNQSVTLQRQTSRASMWQQRLALAQEEYMSRTPDVQRKPSINFLSLKSATMLPSTPSLAENHSMVETRDIGKQAQSGFEGQKVSLWKPASPVLEPTNTLLWTLPVRSTSDHSSTLEPPAASLRPPQRKEMLPLVHTSSSLWMKPANSGLSATRPIAGLWGSKTSRPKSIQTRPVTQRPPRRSKRITFLPDIVESPSPLPDKRGTLGLYQFPWGEKSDSAVYQPPPINPALMMGQPAIIPALQARARELEDDEYSSSFFDDYDDEEFEEEDDEDYENSQDVPSDDDFDESTLWEIASLLKTREGVPSKNSLLPQPNEYINDYEYNDFEDEPYFEDGPEYVEDQSLFEPTSYSPQQRSSLWMENDESPVESRAPGLPQPPADVWESYIPIVEERLRSRPMSQAPLPSLASKQLWGSEASAEELPVVVREELSTPVEEAIHDKLQAAPVEEVIQEEIPTPVEEVIQYAPLPRTVFVQPAMWKRSKTPEPEPDSTGLFEPDNKRSEYRTTLASPVAKDLRIQRSSALQVSSLESADMWAAPKTKDNHVSWIDRSVAIPPPATAVSVAVQPTTGLWTAPLKLQIDSAIGLYAPGQLSSRTSDKEPAAVGMVSKPRISRAEISPPTSRRLWRRDHLIIERDWISESSVRPTSPSIDSISSGATSPASDRSSINSVSSASTKASSIWSTMSTASAAAASIKPSWAVPKRKPAPPLPSMPEKSDEEEKKTPFASKLPVRQNSQNLPNPAARRESKVLANAALFESREKTGLRRTFSASRASVAASRFTPPPPKPVYVPLRQQFRPIFIANWDAALREAIAAGSKKQIEVVQRKALPTALIRRKYSPAEWDSALELAIVAGTQKTDRRAFVRPAVSPADWTAALESAIAASTPKSVRRLVRPKASMADWDLALESAISQGYLRSARVEVVNQPRTIINHMWTPPVAASPANKSAPMWQAPASSAASKPSIFDAVKGETLRKARPSKIASLEKLTSHSFWRNDNQVQTAAKHWLHISKARSTIPVAPMAQASRATTQSQPANFMWTAPAKSITASSTEPMWTNPVMTEVVSEDIFNHAVADIIRKSKPSSSAPLPTLISTSFWQPAKKVETSSNWLKNNTVVKQESLNAMWTAPANRIVVSSTASMWTKPTRSEAIRGSIFGGIMGETIRKSKAPNSTPLPTLTSTSFWKPADKLRSTSVNWLKPRSVVRNEAPKSTWTMPTKPIKVSSVAAMWTKSERQEVDQEDIFSDSMGGIIRKPKPSSSVPLPTLTSKSFWQPSANTDSATINWLENAKTLGPKPLAITAASMSESELPRSTTLAMSGKALTWTPSSTAPNTATSNSQTMWTPPQPISENRRSIFASTPMAIIRKSPKKTLSLPKLVSKQLYEPSKEKGYAPTHWLHVSSKTLRTPITVAIPEDVGSFDFGFGTTREEPADDETEFDEDEESAYDELEYNESDLADSPVEGGEEMFLSAGLWMPIGQKQWTRDGEMEMTGLWDSASSASPDIFEEVYKNEPRHRSKRNDKEVEGIKTFELWRPSCSLPEVPRNWLIQKRASKVDFRY